MAQAHYKIAIVGAGPAGISLAIELKELGCDTREVIVLEKGAVPIDAIRKFYPEKKMTIANYKGLPTVTEGHLSKFDDLTKAQTLTYFDDLINKYNLQIVYNAEVSKILKTGDRFSVAHGNQTLTADFVAVGIGILGRPNKPTYKIPPALKNSVLFDLTSQKISHQKVLVVGGGDTSSEYCQVLVNEGNEVTLAYRGEKFTRMMPQNLQAAESLQASGKLRILLNCSVKEIGDEGGKPVVIFEDDTRFKPEVFDRIVYAMGGTTPVNFLKNCGVSFAHDWPEVSSAGETNVKNLFLLGDLVAGKLGGSIVTAYNVSFRAAQKILGKM